MCRKKKMFMNNNNIELETAEQVYHQAMCGEEYLRVPSVEEAKHYILCVELLIYYSYSFTEGIKTMAEIGEKRLRKQEDLYDAMKLDMRDVIFSENGKQGLRRATDEIVVPPIFDAIRERYNIISIIRESWGKNWCVPVIRNGKYALCKMDGKGTLLTDFVYERMFRFFGSRVNYFVVEKNGKKGVIEQVHGKEIIPCEMDEIYEMIDFDGVIPFTRDGKWGLQSGLSCTPPIYDDIYIQSEDYAKVRKGDDWYYLNSKGEPVKSRHEAEFGSWYDLEK